jgi:GH35 family endo-1,4-beta-xylanase
MFTPKHKTEEPYQGKLLAYVFATKTWETNISQGPRTLVNKYINDKNKTIATCGVKKMYSWFTGADLQSQQSHVLNDFKTTFLNSNYNVRAIVKAIVKSEEYRRGFATHQP